MPGDEFKKYAGVLDSPLSQSEQAINEIVYWRQGLIDAPIQGIGRPFDPPQQNYLIAPNVMELASKSPNVFKDFLQGVFPPKKSYSVSFWDRILRRKVA